jgi:hypothetical protein
MPLPTANDTDADRAVALQAAREHFALQMHQVMRDIRRILAGRDPRQLVGFECLQHIILRERFNASWRPHSAIMPRRTSHAASLRSPRDERKVR